MDQESPTGPEQSDASNEEAEASSNDPVTDAGANGSGEGDEGSGVEEAVDEAVSEADVRAEDARDTVEETSAEMSEWASETSETVSATTDELADEASEKAEVVVEIGSSEEAALDRVKTVSKVLDEAVRVPGTNFRVGIDPILGIVPGAGDTVAAALSLYPVAEAYRLDAPPKLIAKMLSLIAVDYVIGSVPVAGTVFDAFWKANEWNARSLERHLEGV